MHKIAYETEPSANPCADLMHTKITQSASCACPQARMRRERIECTLCTPARTCAGSRRCVCGEHAHAGTRKTFLCAPADAPMGSVPHEPAGAHQRTYLCTHPWVLAGAPPCVALHALMGAPVPVLVHGVCPSMLFLRHACRGHTSLLFFW